MRCMPTRSECFSPSTRVKLQYFALICRFSGRFRPFSAFRLPEGWRRVESNSRPGEYVYENVNTEERQAWFPTEPAAEEVAAAAVSMTAAEKDREKLKKKNAAALAKRKVRQLRHDYWSLPPRSVPPPTRALVGGCALPTTSMLIGC